MVERLIELVPHKKTVWTIESDTMGMSRMLSDARFVFNLEQLNENQTKVINETHYQPTNLVAKIMKWPHVKIMDRLIIRKQSDTGVKAFFAGLKSYIEKQ